MKLIETTLEEYNEELKNVTRNNLVARVNLKPTSKKDNYVYFKSKSGYSYIDVENKYVGGLFKIVRGEENVTKVHFDFYKEKYGDFFLQCYDTILKSIYEKQGLVVCGRIDFDPSLAFVNYKAVSSIATEPDVVFMTTKNSLESEKRGEYKDFFNQISSSLK